MKKGGMVLKNGCSTYVNGWNLREFIAFIQERLAEPNIKIKN